MDEGVINEICVAVENEVLGDESIVHNDIISESTDLTGSSTPSASISEFPDELVLKILVHLSPYLDLKNAGFVNKRWFRLVKFIEKQTHDVYIQSLKSHNILWQTNKIRKDNPTERPSVRSRITRNDTASTTISDHPSARFSHSAVIFKQHMYLFGGASSDHLSGTTYNDMYALDLTTYRWRKMRPLGLQPAPRECASFVAFNKEDSGEGIIILHAGICRPPVERQHTMGPRFFDDTQLFDINTSTWQRLNLTENYPSARAAESASVVRNSLVTFGGAHRSNRLNEVWVFNFETNLWRFIRIRGKKPPERFGHTQFTIDEDRVLVVGGSNGHDTDMSDVWMLDTTMWSWTSIRVDNIPHEPVRAWCHPPVMVDGDIVVISEGKRCLYCANYIEDFHIPAAPPVADAEYNTIIDCSCGRKWACRNENPNAEPIDPIYLQMYYLDCSDILTSYSCRWLDYHYMSPTPLSIRHFTACAGIDEILIFGGVEESGAHKVDDTTIVVTANADPEI